MLIEMPQLQLKNDCVVNILKAYTHVYESFEQFHIISREF